jgi:hypothetical protein
MTAPGSLQDLLDHQAIAELRARYCWCLDTKRWDELRRLFTDDLDIDVGTLRFSSADEYIAAARERTAGATTVHSCSMPQIEIAGDTATGIWAMSDIVDRGPGPWPDGLAGFRGHGYYHDTYKREADGWRIASVRLERLRFAAVPEGGDAPGNA